MKRFGELLRYYRTRCTDGERNGKLTQEQLGALLGDEIGGGGYTGAAISDWERGKSQIDKDHRRVLVSLIKIFYANGGIQTLAEANTFLQSGNYRLLDEDEKRQAFPLGIPEGRSEVGFRPFFESIFPLDQMRQSLAADSETSPHWTGILLGWLGKQLGQWSSERVLRALAWIVTWLLTWLLTFPLLSWPPASQAQLREATLMYIAGVMALPLLIGVLQNTKDDEFWQQQHLANSPILRFYTHLGAIVGFHVGYAMIFIIALLGYYFRLGLLPLWLVGLAATWPVIVGYAAARQVPFNHWRAFGALRFKDGAVFLVSVLFGPFWGGIFFTYHAQLLSHQSGIPIILSSIGILAALTTWQRRRVNPVIRPYIWAVIFGVLLTLSLLAAGASLFRIAAPTAIWIMVVVLMAQKRIQITLFGGIAFLVTIGLLFLFLKINIWAGRIAVVMAILSWWLKGRNHIGLPPGFWSTLAAVMVCAFLMQQGILDQLQASLILAVVLMIILWFQIRK